jgi:phosphate:Na+ symporter
MTPAGGILLQATGGLGLFLLGMSLMTEGLRSLAGGRLRQGLLRFTRSPWSGALGGALATALLQSSSATTVATVGFVSAGLLSFQASLGIIFGANIGSTGLGWLVALLGIKLNLSQLMLPLLLVGAGLRVLGRERQAQVGITLAGFALLFMGIAALQQAMAGQGLLLDPARFDAGTLTGRLQLVLLGLLTTVITQSSGAGVATTLAALAAGAIALPQGLALVIGFDVGTTITAILAALGGSLSARRTAAGHVVFNLFTAALAFSLLPPYLEALDQWWPALIRNDPEFALTAFHTGFSVIGVLLMLPFTVPFANLIRRLLPADGNRSVDALGDTPSADPAAAISQAEQAINQTFVTLLDLLRQALAGESTRRQPRQLGVLQSDLDRLELYLDQIHLGGLSEPLGRHLVHLLHGLDHLQRLHERCEEEPERLRTVVSSPALAGERRALQRTVERMIPLALEGQWRESATAAQRCARRFEHHVDDFRDAVLDRVAAGELSVDGGTAQMEAMRWLRRVSQHLLRIGSHLAQKG